MTFPSDFVFGTATSSYQIEGTKFGTCGPSHWDVFAKDDGANQFPFGEAVVSKSDPIPENRTSLNWEIYPQGLPYFLKRVHQNYALDIPIIVSENGMASLDVVEKATVNDPQRIDFFQKHLAEVKSAINAGVPVKGYFAWSLLDNFEWAFGYDQRFGIVHVDFETQKRTPKASWY